MNNKILIEFVRESFGISDTVFIEIQPLSVRGSDRTFYRVKWAGDKRAILIHYGTARKENMFYVEIGLFLKTISINVPEIYEHDPYGQLILIEDLGEMDLYSLRDKPWDIRRVLYEKTLDNIIKLHNYPINEFPFGRVRMMESFDASLYAWEHNYFLENFVTAVCGFEYKKLDHNRLNKELSDIIEKLLHSEQSIIHRDLQSQNVIVKDDVPYFIDFQGMRIGNPLYDLASILNDPYVVFLDHQRNYLLEFYYNRSYKKTDIESFKELFWCASCQRLMQALGAYSYLGYKNGIKPFLKHIPSGIKNLNESISRISFSPNLSEIIGTCYEIIASKNFKD
ncbi:MAG TPA: aminoglycoside phosphotransferase family protein [Syntrophorhabdaceae bacterium]|nr:aminoglycoside phosphotransferase family protein [Syntrophorhabdaceae bacterium]HPU29489.1 aminoglycoside phosphotransferase family protein [Syntrophorhabdaceae bacterium]